MYAMQYAEGNFVQNAARLYLQNNDNNLATQGALINSHVKAREQQAEAALRDKTPLITIGRATGHLSDKGYGYSPDLGTVMMFSWRRSEEHTSELQSQSNLVCRLLLEKKKKNLE